MSFENFKDRPSFENTNSWLRKKSDTYHVLKQFQTLKNRLQKKKRLFLACEFLEGAYNMACLVNLPDFL